MQFKIHDESRAETHRSIIDPMEARLNGMLLMYMNDIRLDISKSEPTKHDKAMQNVRFIVAKEKGWPTVFAVTTRKVREGEELLVDYGQKYSDLLTESERWKCVKDERLRQMGIDSHFVRDSLDCKSEFYNLE